MPDFSRVIDVETVVLASVQPLGWVTIGQLTVMLPPATAMPDCPSVTPANGAGCAAGVIATHRPPPGVCQAYRTRSLTGIHSPGQPGGASGSITQTRRRALS